MDTVSGGYLYNKMVIHHMRSFGHEVKYTEDISGLRTTENNIIDSLVLKEAFEYINFDESNIGLIHQVDRNIDRYNELPLIVTGESAKIDLIDNFDVSEQNIHVVKPGMDEDWKVKEKHNTQVKNLLCVSNYLDGKGIDVLLSALGKLQKYDWNLKIAGNKELDTEYYESIRNTVHGFGFQDRVELIGSVAREEINNLMVEADLMVNFSKSETYGMAIQEAIHAKLPVLMFKTGAWEEFITSGLVTVLDKYSVDKLSAEIKHIFESGIDLKRFDSITRIFRRSWEAVGRDIESILVEQSLS